MPATSLVSQKVQVIDIKSLLELRLRFDVG